MDRLIHAALLIASIVLAVIAAAMAAPDTAPALIATDLAVGLLLTVAGTVAWQRRPRSGVGSLVALTGVLWLVGSVLPVALYLHRVPMAALFLSYPNGKLTRRSDQILILASVAINVALPYVGPSDLATVGLAALIAAVVFRRTMAATGPARRALTSASIAAVASAVLLAAGSLARASGLPMDAAMLLAYEVSVVAIGLGLVADLLWGGWSQAAVTGLVIDLGAPGETGSLRDRLALALGDPSLIVGYWVAGSASYVDGAGRPVDLPAAGSGRRATPILAGTERIGVLVHDGSLVEDPGLIPAVAAAASLTMGNARLQAEVRDRVAQVEASRRRLVEAADAERRRIDEELDIGARARLERIEHMLGAMGEDARDPVLSPTLAAAAGEARAALADLRELVRATHHRALRAGGLQAALTELAGRMPIPVSVNATNARFAPVMETTLYFVCSEALTNVAKHARASSATVELGASSGLLRLVVSDDGIGGTSLDGGSGLRGLQDRVEALGGRLVLEGGQGRGTSLSAELPVEVSEAPAVWSAGTPLTPTQVRVGSP